MIEVTSRKNSYTFHIKIFIEIISEIGENNVFLREKYIATVQESSAHKKKSIWWDSNCTNCRL